MTHFDFLQFVQGEGMPIYEGLVTLGLFVGMGVLIAWHNGKFRLGFVAQVLFSLLILRYAESYFVFHQTLREGLWPAAWTCGVIAGFVDGSNQGCRVMNPVLSQISGLANLLFMLISIAVIVRGWPLFRIIMDRAQLVRELEHEREHVKRLESDKDGLTDTVQTARLTSDVWQGEIGLMNHKLDTLQKTVEDLGRKLGLAIGYNVELIDYIEGPEGARRPEPPKEIRADIDRARRARAAEDSLRQRDGKG